MLYSVLQNNLYGRHSANSETTIEDHAIETAFGYYSNPAIDIPKVIQQPWPQLSNVLSDLQLDELVRINSEAKKYRAWIELWLSKHVFMDDHLLQSPIELNDLHFICQLPADKHVYLRWLAMKISSRRKIIQAFARMLAHNKGGKFGLEKYPFHYLIYPELLSALPESKIIQICRHPLDVYASMIRRIKIEIGEKMPVGTYSWLTMPASAFAREWTKAQSCYVSITKYFPTNICQIKYEDLTNDSTTSANTLSNFLNTEIVLENKTPAKPQLNKRFPLDLFTPQPNTNKYRDQINDADKETILRSTQTARAEMGYE